jgi:hypothetical protein
MARNELRARRQARYRSGLGNTAAYQDRGGQAVICDRDQANGFLPADLKQLGYYSLKDLLR